jgi:hypothetical protein
LGDEPGFCDVETVKDPEGVPLGPEAVVPVGVPELSGGTELPGTGVAVAGNEVGLGVARGVGLGVGRGVGTGVGGGVGAVTSTGPAVIGVGFAPLALTALYVIVQLPTGRVELPVHVS